MASKSPKKEQCELTIKSIEKAYIKRVHLLGGLFVKHCPPSQQCEFAYDAMNGDGQSIIINYAIMY